MGLAFYNKAITNKLSKISQWIWILFLPLLFISMSGLEFVKYSQLLLFFLFLIFNYKVFKIKKNSLFYLFFIFQIFVLISIINTVYWGELKNGTLEFIPLYLLSVALPLMSYQFFPIDKVIKYKYAIYFFMALSFVYSIYSVLYRGKSYSVGFYHHHILYAKILSICYIFVLFAVIKTVYDFWQKKSRIHLLLIFVSIGLFFLFLKDVSLTRSRMLAIIIIGVPLIFLFFLSLKNKKILFLMPLFFIVFYLFIPQNQMNKIKNHFSIYLLEPFNLLKDKKILEIKQNKLWINLPKNEIKKIKVQIHNSQFHVFHHLPIDLENILEETNSINVFVYYGNEKGDYHYEYQINYFPNDKRSQRLQINKKKLINLDDLNFNRLSSYFNRPLSQIINDLFRIRFNFFRGGRTRVYQSTIAMIKENYLWGYGPGTWKWAVRQFEVNPYALIFAQSIDSNHYHAHNNLLIILYQSGLFTLIIYLALLFFVIFKWFKILFLASLFTSNSNHHSIKIFYFVSFFCFIAINLAGTFDNSIYSSVAGTIHWILLGILLRVPLEIPNNKKMN